MLTCCATRRSSLSGSTARRASRSPGRRSKRPRHDHAECAAPVWQACVRPRGLRSRWRRHSGSFPRLPRAIRDPLRDVGVNSITSAIRAAIGNRASVQPSIEPVSDDVRLDGKVCLVTGANSGLGKAVAIDLARRGGTVLMACPGWSSGGGRGRQARFGVGRCAHADGGSLGPAKCPAIVRRTAQHHS